MTDVTTLPFQITGPGGVPVNSGTATNAPGDIASIISFITGILGGNQGSGPASMADPWAPNRARYQGELNTFMTDPSSVLKDPAFLAAEGVGAENISRQAGAAGMSGSGNRLADLFKFGQSSALDFEQQKFKQLSDLAGVNAGSPVAAAGYDFLGKNMQGTNLSTGLAGILNMLGLGGAGGSGLQALLKMFGGGGGTPNIDFNNPFANTNDPYTGGSSFAGGGDFYDVGNPDMGTLPIDDSWLTGAFGT
jgi:hypothetical protein